jgi:hypothetical protein
MPNTLDIVLNGGVVTSRGEENLTANEMTSGVGIWYKPGDAVRLHKIEGRTDFGRPVAPLASGYIGTSGTISGVFVATPDLPVVGIVATVFDPPGYSMLLAHEGSGLYQTPLGISGTFTLFYSGWQHNGVLLGGIHDNDRWIVFNGIDPNQVIDAVSGIRRHGMQKPDTNYPIFSSVPASAASGVSRPTGYTLNVALSGVRNIARGGIGVISNSNRFYPGYTGSLNGATMTWEWLNPERGNDISGVSTYAFYMTADSNEHFAYPEGTPVSDMVVSSYGTIMYSGFASSTTPDRTISVKLGLVNVFDQGYDDSIVGFLESEVKIIVDYSQDDGNSWARLGSVPVQGSAVVVPLTSERLSANSNRVKIRIAIANIISIGKRYVGQIFDVAIAEGGAIQPLAIDATAFYGYTEVNENVSIGGSYLESIASYNAANGVLLSGIAGAYLELPNAPNNPTTTAYYIYRTDVSGTAPQDFTKIGQVAVPMISGQLLTSGTFIFKDKFDIGVGDAGAFPYAMVRVVDAYYDRDRAPVAFIHINEFKGSHVALALGSPRRLYYTPPGRRESYPEVYQIDSFPMAKYDALRGTVAVGNTLVIMSQGGIMTMDELPVANAEGVLSADANVRRFDGQPGCVGYRSFCSYSINGAPRAAWVSRFGVHITAGPTAARISDDLDWKAMVNTNTLDSSILFFDEDRLTLNLYFDKDGDGNNDHVLFFHMAPEHNKGSEARPKITGPHPVRVNGLTTAEVSNTPRVFTSHPTDGHIYVEWNGNTDASNAYNVSGVVPLNIKTGKIYAKDFREYSVFKGLLRHNHWGNTDTIAMTWHYGRDLNHRVGQTTKTVSVSGVQSDFFFVGRQGDWGQLELSHYGSGIGSISALQMVTTMGGDMP